MGIKRHSLLLILLCVFFIFPSCNVNTSLSKNLYGIKLKEVKATVSSAYFLSEAGTLYCTGTDSDASSFAVFENKKENIVAKNVRFFTEITNGGCFINQNNDLYIWNKNNLPLYNYNQSDGIKKVKNNIKYVDSYSRAIIYVDNDLNLFLIGVFGGKEYKIDSPKFLADNVSFATIHNSCVVWFDKNGNFSWFGKEQDFFVEELQIKFADKSISQIGLTDKFLLVLSNDELWFVGDYSFLCSGIESKKNSFKLLCNNVSSFSCDTKTIGTITNNKELFVWGRCISNDQKNTETPEFEYYEKLKLTDDAINIYVSDSFICYIDTFLSSNIYHDGGWEYFYGNSTQDTCVGINRAPVKWERK